MTYKNYLARIELDERDNIFVGRVLGLRCIISFHGKTVSELRNEFEVVIDDFLEDCNAQGIAPEKPASGKLMLRVPTETHGAALVAAQSRIFSCHSQKSRYAGASRSSNFRPLHRTAHIGEIVHTAILVIDVQQGLCEGPGAAHDCPGTIARINEVTQRAREAGVPVFFIQHESNAGDLEHGSREWQLATGLQVQAGDRRIRKTTPDAFLRTGLHEALQALDVKDLVVCGMHTEFCVDTTTRKALALGYPVVLVSDAHTSAGNAAISAQQVIGHHNATLINISSFGPKVTAMAHHELCFGA